MGGEMRVRSLAEIMDEVRKRYKSRPDHQDDWRVLGSKDKRGYKDLYFYEPDAGLWHVKGDLKTPHELMGVGARIKPKHIDDEIQAQMKKGKRLPFGLAAPHPKRKDTAIIAGGLGRFPTSREPLKPFLSDKQEELDLELRKKVERMRHKLGLDKEYR